MNSQIAIKEQEILDEEETLCDWISLCTFIGRIHAFGVTEP